MNWAGKRQEIIQSSYPQPTENSNLKRKLALIARIKDLSTGITPEIQSENLQRFAHEIVQTILSINLQKKENVHSIVGVCHYFNEVYPDFRSIFIENLKNLIRDNVNELGALHVYLYYEIMRIDILPFEIKSISKMFTKLKDVQKYKLCEILSSVYDNEYSFALDNKDYPKVYLEIASKTKSSTLNFLRRLEDLSFEQISTVMKNLKEEKKFEKEYIEKNFAHVIDLAPNEFKFYEEILVPTKTEHTLDYFLSHLLWFINSPSEIDFIAKKYIDSSNSENNDKKVYCGMIITKAMKYADNLDTLPVLARFLSWFCLKTVITFLENDSKEQSLILLCELSKFNVYSKFRIIEKLEESIRKKNIKTMSLLLDTIGRFYLHHKETNFGMRRVFEKIKILRNENNDLTRIEINSAVGRILNRSEKNDSIDDFFTYMFTRDRFKGSELQTLLTKEHLLLIFMKPWLFEDHAYIHTLAVENGIDLTLSKLLYESMIISVMSGKLQQSLSYASLYSHFLANTKKIVNKIFSLKIKECEKVYLLMNYLDIKDEKKEFIDEIKIIVDISDNLDVKTHFIHWLSKYNLRLCMIDLDKEIELLRLQ